MMNDVLVRDETRHKHGAIFRGAYSGIQIEEPNTTIEIEGGKAKVVHKNNVNKVNN